MNIAKTAAKNTTAIKGFLILILVIGAGTYGYNFYHEMYEEKAQISFFEAQRLYEANMGAKDYVAGDGKEKSPQTTKVDTAQLETKLTQVITDFPKSTAAVQATNLLADTFLEKNEHQKAIDILEDQFRKNFQGNLPDTLLGLRLSAVLEQNKQFDKSLSILTDLALKVKKDEILPEVLLRQALCYENLNQLDKAKELYHKLSTEYSVSSQGQKAQKYLKLLDENS